MDGPGTRAEAIAIKDGRIVATGSTSDVRELAGSNTRTIDLQGKTALPGLTDAHLHLASDASYAHFVDVRDLFTDVRSIADVVAKMRQRAAQTPPGEWVIARGSPLQEFRMAEQRRPNRHDLDAGIPEHPAYAFFGAHITCVNSKGLAARGITRETPDPPGGTIERDPATGEPTGVLKERAQYLVKDRHPKVDQTVLQDNIVQLLEQCQRRGVTTIHDIVVSGEEIQAYIKLANAGRLPVRVHLLVRVIESKVAKESLLDLGFIHGFGSDFLKLGGIKMSIDGGTTGRNGAFSEPLLGDPHNKGIIRIEQGELDETVELYHRMGMRICTHAVGDVAHRMILESYDRVLEKYPRKDHRHRIEHLGNWMFTPHELEWAKRLDVLPMPNPTGLRHVGDIYTPLLGERMRWAYRFGTILRAGFKTTFSSDGPGSYPSDPLRDAGTLVSRKTVNGNLINPEETVSVEEALRAQTINAAYVGFEEHRLGSLEHGKIADVTVLGEDPFEFPPEQFNQLPVDMVITGGQVKEYV
ncbi:MAG: amidohydrolase [Chloroflexota bacterium]